MCYYTASNLSREEIFQLEHDFVTRWEEQENEAFFVVPGFIFPRLPVITAEKKFTRYRWGLIPAWVKDREGAKKLGMQTLNAQCEGIESKPSYRGAVKNGRFCVIPVNGFYEWHHHTNGEKYPHFIYPRDRSYFLLAGLYEHWYDRETNEKTDTFTIITTPANERLSFIHNTKKRMPAILSTENARLWLDPEIPYAQKKDLLAPYPAELMQDHTVSRLITSRKDNPNQPSVSEKFRYAELETAG